jgi:hypothetical protein
VPRTAAIVLTVAAVAAAAAPSPAAAAGWPAAIASAGFCVPTPENPTAVPEAVDALALMTPSTKPLAVLDTGVDPDSPELAGHVLPGWDAATKGPASGDPDGHGTELAGIAAGSGPGVVGTSPHSPVLPIRIYGPDRTTTGAIVANGIGLAVQQGAGVILLAGAALAGDASAQDTTLVRNAVDAAFAAGVLVVTSMGDASTTAPTVPASLPHVMAVSGANAQNLRAATANSGPALDLLAPSEGVYGPLPAATCAKGYGYSTGSDFATAAVAGAAAAVQALRPTLTTQQLYDVVRRSGKDVAAVGRDDDTGFGFLDAAPAQTVAPPAKEASAEVDDDPFWLRGRYAKAHPALLSATKKRFNVFGTVSAAKDPADLYPVRLPKGTRMVVTLNAADPGDALGLSILRGAAGSFDVTNEVAGSIAVAADGLSDYARLEVTAKKTATYFIDVDPPDAVDPDDPTALAAPSIPYRLTAFTQKPKPKKKAKKKG